MISKKQARIAGSSLLTAARRQRDIDSPALRRFPELARLNPGNRSTALESAQRIVWQQAPFVIGAVVCVLLAGCCLWLLFSSTESDIRYWLVPLIVTIALNRMAIRQTRRELKKMSVENCTADGQSA